MLYLAQTDLMTGLCNRGSGERRIVEFLQDRTGGLLCLLDCDKFKAVNDTYGHTVGGARYHRRCREFTEILPGKRYFATPGR